MKHGAGRFRNGSIHSRWRMALVGLCVGLVFNACSQTPPIAPEQDSDQTEPTLSTQAVKVGSGNGLNATYYDNADFTGASLTRIDPSPNFDWGDGSPAASIGSDTFSARWTGQIEPRYSQRYTFYTTSDDGVRLWVNNQLIINNWTLHSPTTNTGQIALQAGARYNIKLEFYENYGTAVMRLAWSSASQPRSAIAQSQLYGVPPAVSSIAGVSVVANPASLQTDQAAQLTASVTGTGNFNPSVSWSASPSGGKLTPNGSSASFSSSLPGTFIITATSLQNASKSGSATVTVAGTSDAQIKGQWSSVISWPLVSTHAALLPSGKVLTYSTSDPTGARRDDPPTTTSSHDHSIADLWDPTSGTHLSVNNTTTELFCSGAAFLPDGTLVVAGGNDGIPAGATYAGKKDTNLFGFASQSWTRAQDMAGGRWYPTLTALSSGEVVAVAGNTETGVDTTLIPEVFNGQSGWRKLTGASLPDGVAHQYPWMQLAPNGQILNSGPNTSMYYLDTSGTGQWTPYKDRDSIFRNYGNSVMYDSGKLLIVGGGTTSALTINLFNGTIQTLDPMLNQRTHANATITADGTVAVMGGNTTGVNFEDSTSVYATEIWSPKTQKWTQGPSASVPRNYHSTALLLPDGRVISTGSGGCGDTCGANHFDAQLYSPAYLFKKDGSGQLADRPTISGAPSTLNYGASFNLALAGASGVSAVNLIRLGSVTHSNNMEQRLNHLSYGALSGEQITVQAPTDKNLSPPGYYMLFVLNTDGVPSVAKIVQLL